MLNTSFLYVAGVIALTMSLVSCASSVVKHPERYSISGTINAKWPKQNDTSRLRFALFGVGFPSTIKRQNNLSQNAVLDRENNVYNFGVDLPNRPDLAGVYQIVAYLDLNNDGDHNWGEPIANNHMWLIYSSGDARTPQVKIPDGMPWAGVAIIPALQVKSGWNLYDVSQAPNTTANPRPIDANRGIANYDIIPR